jgi:proteasome lid subunit RPN8/RPN11
VKKQAHDAEKKEKYRRGSKKKVKSRHIHTGTQTRLSEPDDRTSWSWY